MPELPEVELVARSLKTLINGRTIREAVLLRERLAPESTPASFASSLSAASIDDIGRRGKHVLVHLSNGSTLIVHLRMSGRFSLLGPDAVDPKFTHAVLHFADGERLVFDDQRHFGLMKVVKTAEMSGARELAKLAPEPLSDAFDMAYFRKVLASSRRNIKELLLDQTKVCGLGNIYAAEALFAAGLDPRILANEISARRATRLFESIQLVLRIAIEHNGNTQPDPSNIDGSYFSGGSPDGWLVYDREDEPCVRCKTSVKRIRQGSRSTYFCRRCQRK